uniref:Uncharacterized protein n=1 Tax=Kalanchoe fedtschenkoi TaxID=63787 RepID=A0A7N0TXW4_KALFE
MIESLSQSLKARQTGQSPTSDQLCHQELLLSHTSNLMPSGGYSRRSSSMEPYLLQFLKSNVPKHAMLLGTLGCISSTSVVYLSWTLFAPQSEVGHFRCI